MYAVETIEAGEIIEAYEEQPHVLVSQTHVRQNWTAAAAAVVFAVCLSPDRRIFVSWSQEPEHWKPINHFLRSDRLVSRVIWWHAGK